ncbi:MAG: transcription antitermination factor NusB [Candidatus Karelsulcia muelleri]
MIPVKVIMNEYIEISKMFYTKQSKLFINGIMEKILTQLKNKIIKIKIKEINEKKIPFRNCNWVSCRRNFSICKRRKFCFTCSKRNWK